jgi:hypothetical protein
MFEDGDYNGVSVNKSSGLAEARKTLNNVIQAAVGAGVKYTAATVALFDLMRMTHALVSRLQLVKALAQRN